MACCRVNGRVRGGVANLVCRRVCEFFGESRLSGKFRRENRAAGSVRVEKPNLWQAKRGLKLAREELVIKANRWCRGDSTGDQPASKAWRLRLY